MNRIAEEEKFEERAAMMYAKFATKYLSMMYPLVADSALAEAKIQKGIAIDLGTGPGYLAISLAKKRKLMEVIGIDQSASMIRIATDNACKEKLRNIRFQLGDIHKLSFRDNYADLITSQGSLHHWNDPISGFKEIYRVLKPKRVAFIDDLRRDTPKKIIENIMNSIEDIFRPYFIDSVNASYTIPELKKMLKEAGIFDYKIFIGFEKKVLIRHLSKIIKSPINEPRGGEMNINILIRK